MRLALAPLCFVFACALIPRPLAGQDIEDAPTPTSIAELLPEAGQPLPGEAWIIVELTEPSGNGHAMYFAWSARRDADEVVFDMQRGDGDMRFTSRLTYAADGTLKSYAAREHSNYRDTTVQGTVVNDQLQLKRVSAYGEDRSQHSSDTDTFPMEEIRRAFPLELVPVIAAHHVREGNLGYTFPVMIMDRADIVAQLAVEDTGTEQVQFEGRSREAHVLVVRAGPPEGEPELPEDRVVRMTCTFLDTGEFIGLTLTQGPMRATARRATAEEVAERFNLAEEERQAEPAE